MTSRFPCNKWKRFTTFLILTAFALLAVILFLLKPTYLSVTVGNGIALQTPSSFWSRDQDLLREFQPALEEKKRQLRELFLGFKNGTLPTVKNVRCPKIWENDSDELKSAKIVANKTEVRRKSLQKYLNETQNCTRFFQNGGFGLASVNQDELSFPLAFSVLVYKDVEQVERLLRAIYRPHNVYCVHADSKSPQEFHASLRLVAGCLPNVAILERSFSVKWGRFTVLEPDLECMRRMWSHPSKWRYFINLTGQEFPLKTNKELVQILQTLKGANDITGTHDSTFHFRWSQLLPAPYNLTISKGDVHIVASREYVDYVLHSHVARHFRKWVKPVFIPDEVFFNTLNHNPQLGVLGSYVGEINKTVSNSFARYKIWSFNSGAQCAGQWVRWICQFGLGDLYRLTHSVQLFANKFSYDYMPLAYDCLEEWYFHKVHLENTGQVSKLNVSVYENSDIVKNRYTGPVLVWK